MALYTADDLIILRGQAHMYISANPRLAPEEKEVLLQALPRYSGDLLTSIIATTTAVEASTHNFLHHTPLGQQLFAEFSEELERLYKRSVHQTEHTIHAKEMAEIEDSISSL